MKRYLLTIVAPLLILSSAIADEISIAPVTIPQGGKATVQICIINPDKAYTAGMMLLSLPTGITVADNDKGNPIVEKGPRLESADHSLGASHLSSGPVQLTIFSITNMTIPETEGLLFSVTVEADKNLAVGTVLQGRMEDIEMSTPDATAVAFGDITFSITIGAPSTAVELDENAIAAPEGSDGEVDVVVKRSLKGGQWNTFCLPLAMHENQLKSAFGDDVELATFSGYEARYDGDEVVGITIKFSSINLADGLEANCPYLIKTSQDVEEIYTFASIVPDEKNCVTEYDNGKSGSKRKVLGSFIGTYHAGTTVPANGIFLNGNKFWYSTGKTQMKGFRAYLMLDDVLAAPEAADARVKLAIDLDGTTGIRQMQSVAEEGHYYNLQGQKVSTPGKGLYIQEGGKKVMK